MPFRLRLGRPWSFFALVRPALAALCTLPLAATAEPEGKPAAAGAVLEITANPLDFAQGKRTFGRLTYRGGLHLLAQPDDFGGFSGLTLSAQGELMAVTDAGMWLTAKVRRENDKLIGLENPRMGRILDDKGRPYRGKRAQDAEALRADADGTFLIAFEQRHRVGRYRFEDGELKQVRPLNISSITRSVRGNQGLEALALLAGGKEFAFFAEKLLDGDGNHTGWHVKDGKVRRLSIARSDEFDITDAVALPDDTLILLERRFVGLLDGVHMRLRLISREELERGGLIRGEELFRGNNFAYAVDNMEGIDAYETEDGETVIAVISDDNFNRAIQRTLLLEFTLDRGRKAAGRAE